MCWSRRRILKGIGKNKKMIKTNPTINFEEFLSLVKGLKEFKSKTGNIYKIVSLNNNNLRFIRESTNVEWEMDMKKVHQAYLDLSDFKTTSFKPYVPRKQSPALGLLLSNKLLIKE
jgi:hypothetical protein